MRTYIYCIILSIFFLYSCSNKNKIPFGIIKPQEMQGIMWDMVRADVLAKEIIRKDTFKNIKTESNNLTENVFQIHNISKSEFENSFAFYKKHPGLLKAIFDSINAVQNRKNFPQTNANTKMKEKFHIIPGKKKNEQ